ARLALHSALCLLQVVKNSLSFGRVGRSGKTFQERLQLRDSVFAPVLPKIEVDQFQVGLRHLRIQAHSILKAALGFCKLASAHVQTSLQKISRGGIRAVLQTRCQRGLSLGQAIGQHQHITQVEIGLRLILVEADCFAELFLRRLKIRLAQIQRTEIIVSRIKVRGIAESLQVVLDGIVCITFAIGHHTFFEFLEGLFGELAVVFGGINERGVAACNAPWQGIFFGIGARNKRDLNKVHGRVVRVEVDIYTKKLIGIIIDGNFVWVSEQVVEAEAALAIGERAGNHGASHLNGNQHRVVGEVAPRDSDIANDFSHYAYLRVERAGYE